MRVWLRIAAINRHLGRGLQFVRPMRMSGQCRVRNAADRDADHLNPVIQLRQKL
jgi:hypothetical protein